LRPIGGPAKRSRRLIKLREGWITTGKEPRISLYLNRRHAGQVLADQLTAIVSDPGALVLALPRGGVPVGFEVARALQADLDVFVVRKLGVPREEELAFGAIASGGVRVLNQELIDYLGLSPETIDQITAREQHVLEAREQLYREGRPAIPLPGRSVLLVDDGLATGASMLAAARAMQPLAARRVTVAVPLGARETCDQLRQEVDQVVCAATPRPFSAVGAWYDDFTQVTDEEVRNLLKEALSAHPNTP
jgi:putative phosphoribosyl transferase